MKIVICILCLALCFCLIGTSIAPRWYGARRLKAMPTMLPPYKGLLENSNIKVEGAHVFFALAPKEKLELRTE